MDITRDEALSRRQRQQNAAAVSSNIQSSDENPDEVANSLNFAREYADVTGNPIPSLELVKEHRDLLQKRMDEQRNKVMLSTARRTATWYRENPMAVLLAKDDVYNLCSLEQATQRFWEAPKGTIPPNPEPITNPSPSAAPSATQSAAPALTSRANLATPSAVPNAPAESTAPAPMNDTSMPELATPSSDAADPQILATGSSSMKASEPPAGSDASPARDEVLTDDERNAEQLIVDIGNARNASAEQFAALEERVRTQEWIDPGSASFYLTAVREGKATAEDVRIYLASRYSKYRAKDPGQYFLEVPKGALAHGVAGVGRVMEFAGQVMDGPELPGRKTLVDKIIRAASLPPDSSEVHLIRQEIWAQHWFNSAIGQSALSAILDGSATEEEIREQLDPLPKNLQSDGQKLADNAKEIFKAAPGYEDSFPRRFGETIGDAALVTTTTATLGPYAGLGVGMMQAGGEGVASAREAGKSEDKQTMAGLLYAPTAVIDAFPIAAGVSKLTNWLPVNTVALKLISDTIDESSKQVAQKILQNIIDRKLYNQSKRILDGVGDTLSQGGALGLFNGITDMGIDALLGHHHHTSRASTHQSGAEDNTRKAIENISAAAQASKLRERSRDEFHELVTRMTPNPEARDVFVPAGAFVKAAKAAGINPEDLVDSRTLVFARTTGSDVKLSMATYATYFAGSKGDGYIMDNTRPHASSLTFAESQAFREHANAYGSVLNARANPAFSSPIIDLAAERRAYNLAVLRSAIAGHPAETVSHFAMSHSAFSSALARSEGRSLDEYLKLYPQP